MKLTQKKLQKVLASHALWVESMGHKGEIADLRYENLEGVILEGSDLEGAILKGTNLKDTNLDDAILIETCIA